MRVVVASRNPVKLEATRRGFARAFAERSPAIEGVGVESGVDAQPWGDRETLRGASQRAEAARRQEPDAEFHVGIEGGVRELDARLTAFAWVVVLAGDRRGRSRTASFELPPAVARLVRGGVELGEADDRVFGRRDSKRRDGAVGILSRGLIDRTALYEPAVVLALLPWLRRDLF